MGIDMKVSLDTNVWIFGLVGGDYFCRKIIANLSRFEVIVPGQVRVELERNLSEADMKDFYRLAIEVGVELNYQQVPEIYITMFESKGLKKGDAIIGGFAEWLEVDKIVSDNRDFLRGLAAGHYFEVMSPQEFCEAYGL